MLDLQLLSLIPLFVGNEAADDMKARVLIIEDDQDIAELIAMYLNRDGIETLICGDGESGLKTFRSENPDLVVLDINLPGIDGYEVLQSMKSTRDVPVLMVTARQEDEDAILGFGMGADDYVSKPFSPKVLAARVRTHLSRVRKTAAAVEEAAAGSAAGAVSGIPGGAEEIAFGPYILDPRTFSLLREGEKVSMSPREVDVLLFLAREPGIPRSPDEIYHKVWGREYGDLSTVAVHIQRVRKKIEDNPSDPRWVRTAHGRGYFFDSGDSE